MRGNFPNDVVYIKGAINSWLEDHLSRSTSDTRGQMQQAAAEEIRGYNGFSSAGSSIRVGKSRRKRERERKRGHEPRGLRTRAKRRAGCGLACNLQPLSHLLPPSLCFSGSRAAASSPLCLSLLARARGYPFPLNTLVHQVSLFPRWSLCVISLARSKWIITLTSNISFIYLILEYRESLSVLRFIPLLCNYASWIN